MFKVLFFQCDNYLYKIKRKLTKWICMDLQLLCHTKNFLAIFLMQFILSVLVRIITIGSDNESQNTQMHC